MARRLKEYIRSVIKRKGWPAPKKGRRKDCNNIEFKSSMEANLYRWWRAGGWKVEYEPHLFYFPRGEKIKAYLPDFKITLGTTWYWVEAKGYWDKASREKVRLFRKYFGKIYIVNWKEYEKIREIGKKEIEGWE